MCGRSWRKSEIARSPDVSRPKIRFARNENQIKQELKKTNPDDITPLQAIDLIYKLKKMDK